MGSILRFLRQGVGDKVDMFVDQHGVLNLQREGQVAQPVGVPAELIPALRPVISRQPIDVWAVQGGSITVSLEVGKFNHLPYTTRWEFSIEDGIWSVFENSDQTNFQIDPISVSMLVRAVVGNVYGEEISDTIHVTLLEVTKDLHDLDVYESSTVRIAFELNGVPESVSWFKELGGAVTKIATTPNTNLDLDITDKESFDGAVIFAEIKAGNGTLVTSGAVLSVWSVSDVPVNDMMWFDTSSARLEVSESGTSPSINPGDLVGALIDKSGNGHHLVADDESKRARIAIDSGIKCLRFTSTVLHRVNDTLLSGKNGATVIAVVKPVVLSVPGASTRILQIQTSAGNSRFALMETVRVASPAGRMFGLEFRANPADVARYVYHEDVEMNRWYIVTAQLDLSVGGNAAAHVSIDGQFKGAIAVSPPTTFEDEPSADILLGGTGAIGSRGSLYDGNLAELICVDEYLDSEHVRRIEEYLAAKYSLPLAEIEFAV